MQLVLRRRWCWIFTVSPLVVVAVVVNVRAPTVQRPVAVLNVLNQEALGIGKSPLETKASSARVNSRWSSALRCG